MSAFLGGGGSGGLTPAPGNLTFYVATTGSDSNPGTSAKPFLTIQHAINVAASYNYQNLYTATINVADGTYAVNGATASIILPPLLNYLIGVKPTLNGDTAAPGNCIISNTLGDAVDTSWAAFWNIQGFQLQSTSGTGYDLLAENYSNIEITGPMAFNGTGTNIGAIGFSGIGTNSQPLTMKSTSAVYAFYAFYASGIITDSSTITFPAGGASYSQRVLSLIDQAVFGNPTFVNAGTVTGNKFFLSGNSYCEYTGSRASFPGNGTAVINDLSQYNGDAGLNFALPGSAGTSVGDYNISIAGEWSFQGQITSNGGSGFASLHVTNSVGNLTVFVAPTGGGFGLATGESSIFDFNHGNSLIWFDNSGNATFVGGVGFTTGAGTFSAEAPDAMLSRTAAATLALGNGTAADTSGTLVLTDLYTNDATYIIRCKTTLTNGAGAQVGTITNAPAAGNPTKWVGIDDNGTIRYIPTWT